MANISRIRLDDKPVKSKRIRSSVSKPRINGKRKGSRFERSVCSQLSLWISKGKRDDIFWRTAMSGGRATIGLKQNNIRAAQAGDIAAIDTAGHKLLNHVVIECKFYANLRLLSGLTNNTGALHNFWFDLIEHAKKFDRHPMLIARENGLPTICLMPPEIATMMFGLSQDKYIALIPAWDCCVILFNRFLETATVPTAPHGLLLKSASKQRIRLA